MVYSAVIKGMTTIKVDVEIRASFGKPGFVIIGLPSRVIDESRERITAALLQIGVRIKPQKVIVNLAPADVDKKSSSVELAIAVALLHLYGLIKFPLEKALFLGELSLSGRIRKVQGFLSIALAAAAMGFTHIYFPKANSAEVPDLPKVHFYPLESLADLLRVTKHASLPRVFAEPRVDERPATHLDFAHIHGQYLAKKALTIAAAGRHNLLLFGEPGAGKSILAQSIQSILPPLNDQDFLTVNRIYSAAGLLGKVLMQQPPWRAPHQSITQLSLLGGGTHHAFGEITLAHAGFLFLDEFAEFQSRLLEMLRQPMEDGWIELTRSALRVRYPARFALIAASNPCPCGYVGSSKTCRCSEIERTRYRNRFSGPMLDRFDMMVRIEPATVKLNGSDVLEEGSVTILKRVRAALQTQALRFVGSPFVYNADLNAQGIKQLCRIDSQAQRQLQALAVSQALSTRQYLKICKVAQTLADLEQSSTIQSNHIMEAAQFRNAL